MIIVVFFLITSVLCFENYTARLNDSQLYVLHRVYINQTDGTCQPIEQSTDACSQYCKLIFHYNPNYEYNNARYFNASTKKCQSQQICDLTIYVMYNSTTNTCYNLYYGTFQPSKNATLPAKYDSYPQRTFYCIHGSVVVDQYNISSCFCYFGWQSSWKKSGTSQISLCDSAIPITRYLPNVNQPYYMVSSDIKLPYATAPNYYFNSLKYYFRLAKYHIVNYFQPYQISIATVFMNRDQTFPTQNIAYIILPCMLILIIVILTIRYRCVQIARQQQQQFINQQAAAITNDNEDGIVRRRMDEITDQVILHN